MRRIAGSTSFSRNFELTKALATTANAIGGADADIVETLSAAAAQSSRDPRASLPLPRDYAKLA